MGLQAGKQLGFTNVKVGSVKYKLMLSVIFEISIYTLVTLESEKPYSAKIQGLCGINVCCNKKVVIEKSLNFASLYS